MSGERSLKPAPPHVVGWCLLLGGLLLGVLYLPFAPAKACPDRPVADCYFPKPTESRDGGIDFRRHWYAQHLAAMGETSLHDGSDAKAWRFLWLRTFHHPVAVRVESSREGYRLVAVELDGAGGYGPGKQLRKVERAMSEAESARFEALVERKGIWSVLEHVDRQGRDGARWVFEFRDGDRYRMVDRWSPEEDPMRELGAGFLALANWRFPEQDMY